MIFITGLAAAALTGATPSAPGPLVGEWRRENSRSVIIGTAPENYTMTVERDDPGFMSYTVHISRGEQRRESRYEGPVDGLAHPLQPAGIQTVTRTGPGALHIVSVTSGVTADRICSLEEAGKEFVCRGTAQLGDQKASYVDTFVRVSSAR